MTALNVEFVDFEQPDRHVKNRDPIIAEFAQVLRANPGRWAKWPKPMAPTSASSMAARINHPERRDWTPQPLRPPEFEARTSRGVLYVRYQTGDQS